MSGNPGQGGRLEQPLEPLLAEVATGLWRLQRRLRDGVEPTSEAWTAAARQVRRILGALSEAGVMIDDHCGVAFDPGFAIDVVSYQQTAGLDREVVIDAEQPSVYRGAAILQRARVIVGVPERAPNPDPGTVRDEEREPPT
jgi:hypothetical protein